MKQRNFLIVERIRRIKSEKPGLIFFTLFTISVIVYNIFYRHKIDINPTYVLAKIYRIDGDQDGYDYKFFYYFDGKKYSNGIRTIVLENQDSLIVLKISKDNPDYWKRIDKELPECLVKKPVFNKSWKDFPSCDQ
jgi:hypothetical protein